MIQAKRSFVKCGDWHGSHEWAILSYATMCLHPSVSLNNEKICREFSEHKIAVCEKTAGLRSGNSSDLNSACLKVLVPVEIFQFSDMHYETERYRDSTHGLYFCYVLFSRVLNMTSHPTLEALWPQSFNDHGKTRNGQFWAPESRWRSHFRLMKYITKMLKIT